MIRYEIKILFYLQQVNNMMLTKKSFVGTEGIIRYLFFLSFRDDVLRGSHVSEEESVSPCSYILNYYS